MSCPTRAAIMLQSTMIENGSLGGFASSRRDAALGSGGFAEFSFSGNEGLPAINVGRVVTSEDVRQLEDDQAWFWTPEWQAKEREADEAIARGEKGRVFYSSDEFLAALDESVEGDR